MERKETYGLAKRDRWPSGPWDGEPDRVEWKSHGLHCLMVRPDHGAWCGYVALPPGHPWRDIDLDGGTYDDDGNRIADPPSIDVHGGITYGPHECMAPLADGNTNVVCHKPAPGEPDDVRWIGFDCCHSGDERPRDITYVGYRRYGIYRDMGYVLAEVESLARQAAEAMSTSP
jgi:hypothetical protein